MTEQPTASQLTAFRRDRDLREWSQQQEELAAVENRERVEREFAQAVAVCDTANAEAEERNGTLALEFIEKVSELTLDYRERLRSAGADAHAAVVKREDAFRALRVEYPETHNPWFGYVSPTYTPPTHILVDQLRTVADRVAKDSQ